jgi:hypothetical protein
VLQTAHPQQTRKPGETTWLTAWQAAEHADEIRRYESRTRGSRAATVTERTIRSWVARGHLTPGNINDQGLQLFALHAVNHAEKATRARALRLVGIPTR